MAQKEEVYIAQIIREMKQGRTTPYHCKDDEGKQYIVKGTNAVREGLVKEWIAAHLGTAFGLPIPDFSLAWVDVEFRNEGYDLYEYNFASSYLENIQDVTTTTLQEIPLALVNDLYMFDYWIQNADRNLSEKGGNPNFFVHQKTGDPVVLDHNLSFDTTFDIHEHKTLHLCASRKEWTTLFDIDKERYTHKFDQALLCLNQAIDGLPEEWLEGYSVERIKAEIIPILQRYQEKEFWEDIK